MQKKIMSFFLFIVFCFGLCGVNKINVSAITYSDNNNGGYEPTEETDINLNKDVSYRHALGLTYQGTKKYSQQVNVLSMQTSASAKTVTWAVSSSSNSGFIRQTVADIAADYEKDHPGWTVLGGINADQYYQRFGEDLGVDGSDYFYPQPYYPMIADYEKWFSITATPYGNGNIVGFTNDGSVDQLLYYNAGWSNTSSSKVSISGFFITVYRDNKEIGKFLVEGLNQNPSNNGTTIFSPYYSKDEKVHNLEVNGNDLYFVENADLAYTSNSKTFTYKEGNNQDAFFGKGLISSKVTKASVGAGSFVIKTNNQELKDVLGIGDYVVCQYEYEGKLNEVEAAIGFHTIMRNDGVDNDSNAAYNTKQYPRSIFGRKDDGTIVLLTIDGSQASKGMNGANQNEANAILKHYGVTEAYQMDGGGSVTMVIKKNGKFETVNSPSDGSDRRVLSALLFVVKDIKVETKFTVDSNKIIANVNLLNDDFEHVYLKINGETKEVGKDKLEFLNLKSNTEYQYEYFVLENEELRKSVVSGFVSTTKIVPVVNSVFISYGNEKITFFLDIYDPDSAVLMKTIIYDGKNLNVSSNYIEIEFKNDIDIADVSLKLSYNLGGEEGRENVEFDDILIKCDLFVAISNIKYKMEERIKDIYE